MKNIQPIRLDDEEEDQEKDAKPEPLFYGAAKSLYQARTIMIFGEIESKLAERVSAQILAMASESDDDIKIIVNSPGGHVESGDTIVDLIRFVKPTVKVLGSGWVASMGAMIYLAAKPENRFSLPHTRYMLHQPLGGVGGRASDIAIEAQEIIKMRDRINQYIADATGQPLDRVKKDTDRNYWLSPEEALDYGMVGKIVKNQSEF